MTVGSRQDLLMLGLFWYFFGGFEALHLAVESHLSKGEYLVEVAGVLRKRYPRIQKAVLTYLEGANNSIPGVF